jgi:hypothetical protein
VEKYVETYWNFLVVVVVVAIILQVVYYETYMRVRVHVLVRTSYMSVVASTTDWSTLKFSSVLDRA